MNYKPSKNQIELPLSQIKTNHNLTQQAPFANKTSKQPNIQQLKFTMVVAVI